MRASVRLRSGAARGVVLVLIGSTISLGSPSHAAPPRLAGETQVLRWTGTTGKQAVSGETDILDYELEIDLPRGTWTTGGGVQIGVRRSSYLGDIDLFVLDPSGERVADSVGFGDSDSALLDAPENGTYTVQVDPYSGPPGMRFEVRVEVERPPAPKPLRDLLPNLTVLPQTEVLMEAAVSQGNGEGCDVVERVEHDAKRCLRFSHSVANFGDGPFEIRYRVQDIGTTQTVYQRVYRSDGTSEDRPAATYEYHAAHQHFHYKALAVSQLWPADPRGRIRGSRPVRTGLKNGFCLMDVDHPWFHRKGDAPWTYDGGGCDATSGADLVNGVSKGWSDVYGHYLSGQYIDVSGIEDGYYVLRTVVDPDDSVEETNEADNSTDVLIRLCGKTAEVVGKQRRCPRPGEERVARQVQASYVSTRYSTPAGQVGYMSCAEDSAFACVLLHPGTNERYVDVEVQDVSGQPVYAYIFQDANGDGWSDTGSYGPTCGSSTGSVRIVPGVEIRVFLLTTRYCTISAPTTGTVTATFSNVP